MPVKRLYREYYSLELSLIDVFGITDSAQPAEDVGSTWRGYYVAYRVHSTIIQSP